MKIKLMKSTLTGALLFVSFIVNATFIQIDSSADSYINNSAAKRDTNYGSNAILPLKNDGDNPNGWHRQTYIRFDLSSISAPIFNAVFDISIVNNSVNASEAAIANVWDIEIYGLLDGAAGNNWGEMDITWNNAPGNDLTSHEFTNDFQYLGTLSIENLAIGGVMSFSDLALDNFLNSDTDNMVTLGLRRSNLIRTGGAFDFASKENTSFAAPSLSIVVPEPFTLTILSFSIILLSSRRLNNHF
jgi:hypothetical protein